MSISYALAVVAIVSAFCSVLISLRIVCFVKRFSASSVDRLRIEIEMASETKLVIEDLLSRDPSLEEPLEVARLGMEKHIASLTEEMSRLARVQSLSGVVFGTKRAR